MLKLGLQHQVVEYYQVCSNDDPGLNLTYFMEGQIWSLMFFVFFIVVCDIKVGSCS